MIVVRLRTTKLVVRNPRAKRSVDQVLEYASTTIVANDDKEFRRIYAIIVLTAVAAIAVMVSPIPVLSILIVVAGFQRIIVIVFEFLEAEDSSIMIAPQRLTRISLKGVQSDQVSIKR